MTCDLSVIICTYMRTHRLIKCLESLEAQTLAPNRFDVLVVSRDLADEHARDLEGYIARSSLAIRHVEEHRPGLSVARNAGVRYSTGRNVLFLDDDVIADPACLKTLVDLLDSTGALCSGGKILPRFITPPPGWLRRGHNSFLGLLDLGTDVADLTFPSHFPVGANAAYKREAFERAGLFDEDLGIHGRRTAGGEESDLCYRIQASRI